MGHSRWPHDALQTESIVSTRRTPLACLSWWHDGQIDPELLASGHPRSRPSTSAGQRASHLPVQHVALWTRITGRLRIDLGELETEDLGTGRCRDVHRLVPVRPHQRVRWI